MAQSLEENEPRAAKKDRTLRRVFELKDPTGGEAQTGNEGEQAPKTEIKSRNVHPFYGDPFLLPKVNRHLRVLIAD